MISDRMGGDTSVAQPFRSPSSLLCLEVLAADLYGQPEDERLDVALGPDSHRDGTLLRNKTCG